MFKPRLHYALRPDKSVRDEVLRILGEIAARGQFLATGSAEPGEELIHEGRLLIKRLRALMWFARPALGAKVYATAQADLRKAAGLLAGPRDLVAARTTLEKLRGTASCKRDEEHISQVASPLSGGGEAVVPTGTFRRALAVVGASAGNLADAAHAEKGWPSPRKRVELASEAARKAADQAHETGSDADFHTWRKRAKRLLYQLELTQPHPTPPMSSVIASVEKLQDRLGLYHDQVVTEDRLRTIRPPPSSAGRVLRLLARSKKRLRKEARKIKREIGRTI